MYDFTKTHGSFMVDMTQDKFRWLQENGHYFLDPVTFDFIPASFLAFWTSRDSQGYSDKQRTNQRYERAVWDAHSSLAAKARNMTYMVFLRMRLRV